VGGGDSLWEGQGSGAKALLSEVFTCATADHKDGHLHNQFLELKQNLSLTLPERLPRCSLSGVECSPLLILNEILWVFYHDQGQQVTLCYPPVVPPPLAELFYGAEAAEQVSPLLKNFSPCCTSPRVVPPPVFFSAKMWGRGTTGGGTIKHWIFLFKNHSKL